MMLCKLYQLGGKFFCCYGGVVCGNSNTRILMSFMTLLVLPAVFLGLEYYHSIPFDNNVLMPLTLVFALTSLIGFFSSAFADPGILRKQNISSIEQLNIDESNPLFCGFCRVERPNERTLHCKMCDVCVEEMDHHCGWMSNCVGKRTRKRFFFTILSIAFYFSFLALVSLWRLEDELRNKPLTIYRSLYLAFFAAVYTGSAFFVNFLAVFHCYFICTGKTTIEFLTNKYKYEKNPYNKGLCANLSEFLFRDRKTKYIDLEYLQKTEELNETTHL